jgi:hypothetical protein
MTAPPLRRAAALLLAVGLTVSSCGSDRNSADPPPTASVPPAATASQATTTTTTTTTTVAPTSSTTTTVAPPAEVRLDHVQMIGSHNSFHLVPDPTLFAGIEAVSAELARDIEYSHRTLTEQLADFGIRQFELDVFADPTGGRYANRAANPVVGLPAASGEPALDTPGFKVLHTQDFDYESTCLTLVSCLTEIADWSVANPGHLPIMILLELKDLSVPAAAAEEGIELTIDLPWAEPVETTAEVLATLDAEVRSVFGPEQLFTPDDLRGTAGSLDEAVRTTGWPAIDDVRGRVLVALNDAGEQRDLYIADTPVLEGRAMFTSSTPGAPDAAFVRFDDPFDVGLDAAARAGYLIRTRTDSPTEDARANDTATRDAALAGGAHFLSTDYYEPSAYFDSPYVVALPDGAVARCNPVTAPPTCTAAALIEP